MPGDVDYRLLGQRLRHPDRWSSDDRAQMRRLLAQQDQLVESTHPKDPMARARLQTVAAEIEAAMAAYDRQNQG